MRILGPGQPVATTLADPTSLLPHTHTSRHVNWAVHSHGEPNGGSANSLRTTHFRNLTRMTLPSLSLPPHQVWFSWKEGTSAETITSIMQALRDMGPQIDVVVSMRCVRALRRMGSGYEHRARLTVDTHRATWEHGCTHLRMAGRSAIPGGTPMALRIRLSRG